MPHPSSQDVNFPYACQQVRDLIASISPQSGRWLNFKGIPHRLQSAPKERGSGRCAPNPPAWLGSRLRSQLRGLTSAHRLCNRGGWRPAMIVKMGRPSQERSERESERERESESESESERERERERERESGWCEPDGGCRIHPGNRGGSRPVSRVLSGTVIHLGRTSPCASSDLPGDTRGPRGAAQGRSSPYLVLLRVGFTLPPALPSARCALTAPFHPYRSAAADRGGIFSVALAVGSRPPGVTWHPALWSPDFPPLRPSPPKGTTTKRRLSGQLRRAV